MRSADDDPVGRLLPGIRAGQARAVARALTLVESNAGLLPRLMAAIAPSTGRARVIGLTGSPGVGKSTLTATLIGRLRGRGERVGVLAVDPSSPFSGGALLGDRVRMQDYATDSEVLIRSMATRGHLGGVAAAAPAALRVFDAAGCDTVLVETVGVGQSEVEVARLADIVLVLLAPGMGDGIQAAKAGILEVGDLFVVNKADRDGHQALIRDLRTMVALGARTTEDWKPPIVATVAVREEGLAELEAAMDRFRAHAEASGQWSQRRLDRARHELTALGLARLQARLSWAPERMETLARAIRDGELDAYAAADRLVTGR